MNLSTILIRFPTRWSILIVVLILKLVLGSLENIGFIANMATLVLYFHLEMHFDLSTAANTLTNFLGSTFLLTIVGGFISDTYLNRLYTCLLFGLLELMVCFFSNICWNNPPVSKSYNSKIYHLVFTIFLAIICLDVFIFCFHLSISVLLFWYIFMSSPFQPGICHASMSKTNKLLLTFCYRV